MFGQSFVLISLAAIAIAGVSIFVWAGRRGVRSVARVHVDDLATGRLPAVCIRTGQPADLLVNVESGQSRFQPWWLLLLFLGPIGIIAIVALYAFAPRHNHVGGVLPITGEALDAHNRNVSALRKAWMLFAAVAVAGLVGSIVLAASGLELATAAFVVAAGGAALVLAVSLAASILDARWVGLRPDASGRWVAVERVHPDFVYAVMDHSRDQALQR